MPHGRTYMMPSSQGAPMAWVAEGMPAAPPVDPRYVERHYYHPADAAGVYAACDEYGAHGCDCSAIPERQHSGVVMAERQYSTSAMVDRQYSNDAYEQYYAYPGHNYHQQPSHAHAHHQAPPHHQHPHPHHHYHHQHSQHQHHQQAVMVPAAPMYMKQEDEAYAAKPWPAQAATPAQQHLSTPAPVAVPEAHERAGNGSEAGPWIGMSPSDYCLPGLDCAGSPVLRGLDDLVEHML